MGVIFKNENTTEDMIEILKEFQSYLPYTIVNGMKVFTNQLCAGDQLSVERAVNSIHSVSNGYTPEGRLEGFTMQLGDWHTGVKILEVSQYPVLVYCVVYVYIVTLLLLHARREVLFYPSKWGNSSEI